MKKRLFLFSSGVSIFFLFGAMADSIAQSQIASDIHAPSEAVENYVYEKTPQGDLSLWLDFPPGWKQTDRRPAILFFSAAVG